MIGLNDRPQFLPWRHRRRPRIWLCGPRRRRERAHPISLGRLTLFISSRLALRAEPRLTRVAPRSDCNGPDRMPTRRARRTHTAHNRRQKEMFPPTPSSSLMLASPTSQVCSWLEERSVVRENVVGAVLELSVTQHGGQWNGLSSLFLLLVQQTLHGLALEGRLILGVE